MAGDMIWAGMFCPHWTHRAILLLDVLRRCLAGENEDSTAVIFMVADETSVDERYVVIKQSCSCVIVYVPSSM